ncbi:hypothetical protein CSV79_04720 [Sporosarcina sp. P13]|uniref:TRAP transporter substrate-binding protein DctP n=1 Tax=Sporosarcina sp. P13 TaxID=2048263 RepID=UPI000C1720E2|nr:TRAP transporter substrate-binding protein DctP [Sporosarcina sp. P13]PIC64924.1 hypothetical protein CSV79_04720 [Sporosarcina sp. P13]
MRKKYSLTVMLLLVMIIAACSSEKIEEKEGTEKKSDKQQEKVVLKFATHSADNNPLVINTLKPFMKQVEELTDGQVEFEFYPGEQLGKAADLLDLTNDGVTDMGYYIAAYTPSQMPIANAIGPIPGIYTKIYEGSMAFHELSKQSPMLESDFLSNGVRPLFSYVSSQTEFWSKGVEIKVPNDLKGLKVRVAGNFANKSLAALGATPINLPLQETYEGFQRGVFDVNNMNTPSVKDFGLDEIITYGTSGTDFGSLLTGIVINEKRFNELPENVQEVLVQVGDEFTASSAKFYDEYTVGLIKEFEDAGITMHELTKEEKQEWKKFYDTSIEKWVEDQSSDDFHEALEIFKEAVEKYK